MPVPPNLGPLAAVAISKKRRRILRAFREVGATGADRAKTLGEVGLSESLLLKIQRLKGVLVEVEGGRYYLDVERNRQVDRIRRMVVVGVIALAVAAVLLMRVFGSG